MHVLQQPDTPVLNHCMQACNAITRLPISPLLHTLGSCNTAQLLLHYIGAQTQVLTDDRPELLCAAKTLVSALQAVTGLPAQP